MPNAFGLHDVLGNVWEWCEDGWDPAFYSKTEANGPELIRAPHARKGGNRRSRGLREPRQLSTLPEAPTQCRDRELGLQHGIEPLQNQR